MAYRTGSIVDADPAARFLEQIELAMLDQCGLAWIASTAYGGAGQTIFVRGLTGGVNYRFEATTAGTSGGTVPDWSTATSVGQTITDGGVTWTNRGRATWEFVESPDGANVYRVWRNRGSVAANPNQWGQDFYIVLVKVSATALRSLAFEEWDATAKNYKKVVIGTTVATNADASYGLAAGYLYTNVANITYTGFTGFVTTGFNYYIRATRNQLHVGIKQSTIDDWFAMGVFESFLTTNPAETFPLYMFQARGLALNNNWRITTVQYGWSRHPGRESAASATYSFQGQAQVLGYSLGGIDAPTIVDNFHDDRWLIARTAQLALGGEPGGGNSPATYGWVRGVMYEEVLLGNNGATARIGDTVPINGVVHVRFSNTNGTRWLERDAI